MNEQAQDRVSKAATQIKNSRRARVASSPSGPAASETVSLEALLNKMLKSVKKNFLIKVDWRLNKKTKYDYATVFNHLA